MATNSADSLAKKHEQELSRFKRGAFLTSYRLIIAVGILFAALLGIFRLISQYPGDPISLDAARRALISIGSEWHHELAESQERYSAWLSYRGTRFEQRTFNKLSQSLLESAASLAITSEEPGLLTRTYLGAHSSALRLGFLLLASTRLWIVVIGGCVIWGLRPLRPWTGNDALGQTGNGRVFFSGVRISIDNPTPEGAPADQVTGLACPGSVPIVQVRNSELAGILNQYGAVTTTNLRLIGIIEFHREFPAYVAFPGEEGSLESFYEGAALSENIAGILKGALQLHATYRGNSSNHGIEATDAARILKAAHQGRKVTATEHIALVVDALDRVLTPTLKESLALLDPASIATVLLALEAGKSLAYVHEGGKWIRKSNFPQLSARAVLHSIPEFSEEYDYDLRSTIRRALIFGSRSSVFAPVKFPIDFREESRAARQWADILLATPAQLATTADEVQLLGIVNELHQRWETAFFEGASALNPEITDHVFATPQRLIFMPVSRVIRIFRGILRPGELEQLESLVTVVSQEQARRVAARLRPEEGDDERGALPSYERIFPPFSSQQINELAQLHNISPQEIKDWSSLRVVLNSYGWLGRRVSDRSVPESSVVFSISNVGNDFPGANSIGLLGNSGVVPLRSTRLEERWGKLWATRFMQVGPTRMAESTKDFERLLTGVEDEVEKEPGGVGIAQSS